MTDRPTLLGFDYLLGRSVEHTRAAWQARMMDAHTTGGYFVNRHGQTFLYDRVGECTHEIYSSVFLLEPVT